MARAVLLVMDSLGVGAAPDAAGFGDAGADTLGHIADYCARPLEQGGRGRALEVPVLRDLGLAEAAALARGGALAGIASNPAPNAVWGCAREQSTGKDTVSGHWELCGLPVDFDWGYFSEPCDSLPASLVRDIAAAAGCEDVLGNCHASGTEIIRRLGAAHFASGWPIVYTSADSVVQIAAHEKCFGLERLYALCEATRGLVDEYRIGRVIARPFVGCHAGEFQRTANRRDWATPPTGPTLLDAIREHGGSVVGVGKIGDIFAMQGIDRRVKASGLQGLMDATRDELASLPDGGLVFTNLVDFDQEYGHRRDVAGYAAELECFDAILGGFIESLADDDLLLLPADHGNDPTFRGSDHTREYVPVLAWSRSLPARAIGIRDGMADVGQSIARWFGIPPLQKGEAFI